MQATAYHMTNINQKVVAELKAMKEIGMRVPAKVIKAAETADLSEYDNMRASEIADLLIDLA
jgi:DNA uptake protein ComE-like DNA-binding protein